MQKRRLSVAYVFFYLLFSDDTWRILGGFILAVLLGPPIVRGRGLSPTAEVMVWVMVMAIGWSLTAWPARKITAVLKQALQKVVR